MPVPLIEDSPIRSTFDRGHGKPKPMEKVMDLSKTTSPKIALLGCSGWVSFYLASALKQRIAHATLVGTYANKPPASGIMARQLPNANAAGILAYLEWEEVDAVVNLTRGETEEDFHFHQKLIEFCNGKGLGHYYCSSFNACDAQLAHDHDESELPQAQSDYGKFKARCERALLESSKQHAIFRFSASHGWAPNRIARTEEFLKKLAAGESISVHRGIIQNRTAVTHLAEMMAAVIAKEATGIFHLGTTDASDEIDFLRRLAFIFGHDPEAIIPGEDSPTNANMVPGKILQIFGRELERTEADTLSAVANMPGLAKYKRPQTDRPAHARQAEVTGGRQDG